jgi:hypothetical protein
MDLLILILVLISAGIFNAVTLGFLYFASYNSEKRRILFNDHAVCGRSVELLFALGLGLLLGGGCLPLFIFGVCVGRFKARREVSKALSGGSRKKKVARKGGDDDDDDYSEFIGTSGGSNAGLTTRQDSSQGAVSSPSSSNSSRNNSVNEDIPEVPCYLASASLSSSPSLSGNLPAGSVDDKSTKLEIIVSVPQLELDDIL